MNAAIDQGCKIAKLLSILFTLKVVPLVENFLYIWELYLSYCNATFVFDVST